MTSTINVTVPATDSALTSAPIRNNFIAAANDINGIETTISNLGNMADQDQNNVTITGGAIAGTALNAGTVPLTAIAAQAAKTIVANTTSGSAVPTASTLTQVLDTAGLSNGDILYRQSLTWGALNIGPNGYVLTSQSGYPAWANPSAGGTVIDISLNLSDGITGTVDSPTTDAVINLQLGNITPSSVTVTTADAPPLSQISAIGGNGNLELLSYGIGDQEILFDTHWSGTDYVATNTTIANIREADDALEFYVRNGQIIGMAADYGLPRLVIAGDSGNVGIANTSPLDLLTIGTSGTILGALRLEGDTGGYVRIIPSTTAGDWTFTLPPDDGSSGLFLRTDGAGVTSWADAGTGTVTSVTFTGDGTVLSSTPSMAVTTTGTLNAALASAPANTILGNSTSGSLAPAYTTDPVISGSMTANVLVSTVATGTAPLTVSSTTQVANLNVARSGLADTVTVTDAGGDTTTFPLLGGSSTGSEAVLTDAGLTYNATTKNLTTTTFTGALNGNATSTTNIATTDDTATNASMFFTWVSATGGNEALKTTSTKWTGNPSTGAVTITASTAATAVTVAGITSGTAFSSSATSGNALVANAVSTGLIVSGTGITSGTGINLTSTTTGIGYNFNTTSATASTQSAVKVTGSATMTADYTGNLVAVTPTKTMTAAATRLVSGTGHMIAAQPIFSITGTLASIMTVSGSMIDFSRTISNASSSASSSMNMQATLLSLTNTKGTATNAVVDTGILLSANQANATASGDVVRIANSGTGNSLNVTGGLALFAGNIQNSILTVSSAVATDASKNLISVANTGTGNNVLATSPTLTTPNIGAATGTSLSVSSQLTSTVAIGTAPLVVTSTTLVPNLYVARAVLADSATTNANLTGAVTSVGNATSLGSFSSAALSAALTDETGTGVAVFATSPTLVTPNIGAATGTSLSVSGQLTSTIAIGTAPLVVTSTTLVANLYATRATLADTVTTNANLTGEATSTGNAVTLTNSAVIGKVLTGYTSGAGTVAATDTILQAIQKLNGNNATNANLTGPITSVGNATSIASQTGTGTKFVVDTSPTLITPILGVAAATSINFGGTNPLATYSSGTWTPTWTGLTVVGTPTYQGTWTKIGRIVFCTLRVSSTTTTTSIANTTHFTGLPFTSAESSTMTGVTTNNVTSVGVGYVDSAASYTPSWSAVNGVMLSFSYIATTD